MSLMSAPTQEFNVAGILNPVFDPLLCLDVLGIVVTLTGGRLSVRFCSRMQQINMGPALTHLGATCCPFLFIFWCQNVHETAGYRDCKCIMTINYASKRCNAWSYFDYVTAHPEVGGCGGGMHLHMRTASKALNVPG